MKKDRSYGFFCGVLEYLGFLGVARGAYNESSWMQWNHKECTASYGFYSGSYGVYQEGFRWGSGEIPSGLCYARVQAI